MTTVKVDMFKSSGKWYSSFEFQTHLPAYKSLEILKEVEAKEEFIEGMSYYVLDIQECSNSGKTYRNKYLFIN